MLASSSLTLTASVASPMSTSSGTSMRQAWGLSRRDVGSLPTDVGPLVVRFLRELHPAGTAKAVARDTGMSPASVEKLIERQSAPNAANLLRLIAVYGPPFLAAVLPDGLGWLADAARAEEAAELDRTIAAAERRLAELRA